MSDTPTVRPTFDAEGEHVDGFAILTDGGSLWLTPAEAEQLGRLLTAATDQQNKTNKQRPEQFE